MLAQNLINKYDQPIVYAFRLLNKVEQNYITIERKVLVMFYVLHKFKHFLLGNKFALYENHVVMVYLVNKPHALGRITRWLLLFLEYEFTVIYKPSRTYVIVDVLSKLPNGLEPLGVLDPTVDASLFFVEPMWMQEVKTYLEIGQMLETLNLVQKYKLARKVKPFILKEGIMYKMGQHNKLHRCLTTSGAQIISKALHERVARGYFAMDLTTKTNLDVKN